MWKKYRKLPFKNDLRLYKNTLLYKMLLEISCYENHYNFVAD